jgi:hypothetical protein
MHNVVGVVDALQGFGGFFNQPKGSLMKKVLATLLTSFVAASVFAASPAPSATAAAETAKPAALTKKHKASKEGKQKIAPATPATPATPASAAVK